MAFGEFGLLFTLPLLLHGALGYSALRTGVLVLALAMGTFLASGMTPQLTRRLGGRGVVQAGLAAEVVVVTGLGLTLTPGLHVAGVAIAAWLFLYSVGGGMATAQLTSVILTDAPARASGGTSGSGARRGNWARPSASRCWAASWSSRSPAPRPRG